jgi:hypothetical protein
LNPGARGASSLSSVAIHLETAIQTRDNARRYGNL